MRQLTLLCFTFALTACAATDFWSAALLLALMLPACFTPADELGGMGGGGATAGGATAGGATAGGTGGGTGGSTGTAGGRTGTAGGTPAAGGGGNGYWEACCIPPGDGGRIGTISTCYCPGTFSCNFGWFMRCGDGCVNPGQVGPDGGFCG